VRWLELLSWGCSSGHRGVCSVRKANRAAGCACDEGAWGEATDCGHPAALFALPGTDALGGAAEGSYEQEAAAAEETK
jgi:hypothetical protein